MLLLLLLLVLVLVLLLLLQLLLLCLPACLGCRCLRWQALPHTEPVQSLNSRGAPSPAPIPTLLTVCTPPPSLPVTGPPVPTDTPLSIATPSGAYVRTDNTTGLAYTGSGSGTTTPELYLAYHAENPSDRSPLQPGQTALMQSVQTGMWCRWGCSAVQCVASAVQCSALLLSPPGPAV